MAKKGAEKLIEFYGSQSEAARALGVHRQSIHYWTKHGIPPRKAYEIVRVTGKRLTIKDLLPEYTHAIHE